MKTIKILFADDDLKYSMLLKRFLEAEGYEVTYAGNGNIALQQFPLIKPDLVLLDINMPELNGFEVAAKIRRQNHQVLIFFLSDRSDKADRLKGFDLQANDYLAKPFYPEELLARIRERFQCVDNRIETEIYTFGKSTFNYTTNEIRTGNNKVLITSRQAEILRILAKNLHVPVDREILLKHVWGASSYANSLALNVQITYLRKALRNDSSVKIESLMKKGYVLHTEKVTLPSARLAITSLSPSCRAVTLFVQRRAVLRSWNGDLFPFPLLPARSVSELLRFPWTSFRIHRPEIPADTYMDARFF